MTDRWTASKERRPMNEDNPGGDVLLDVETLEEASIIIGEIYNEEKMQYATTGLRFQVRDTRQFLELTARKLREKANNGIKDQD